MMRGFNGFPPGPTNHTLVPNLFFSELLPMIDDLAELKLTVYCFWALQQRDDDIRYVRRRDMAEDTLLLGGLAGDPVAARRELERGLERATARGTLLHVVLSRADVSASGAGGTDADQDDHLYFMNTDRGRAAVESLESGAWSPGSGDHPIGLIVERPNIFALYEQNIGALTPFMADTLRDAERRYPSAWIVDAMRMAVERNIRNWRYVEGIMNRWFAEGKSDGPVRADAQKDRSAPYGDYEQFWDND